MYAFFHGTNTHIRTFGLFLIGLVFLGGVQVVSAVDEVFTVRTTIGADTMPPTVPGNLTATPISTSQIDLAWDASTDDWILSGYHVWRDAVLIATTTATTYADTGLLASTTYTYYITAFDEVGNESASSTEVSTTTPNPPVIEVEEEGEVMTQYSTRTSLATELVSLEIIPGQREALLRFTTSIPVRAGVRFGETTSYEMGSLRERAFGTVHELRISDLSPETQYYFALEGERVNGRYGAIRVASFTTLPDVDVFPPGNVLNFRAERNGNDVSLLWENPGDGDFETVRIMRSDRFYPLHETDGWMVYEGTGTASLDRDVIQGSDVLYYTAFTYDALGNRSSGAVAVVVINPVTDTSDPDGDDRTVHQIDLTTISFFQDGELREYRDGKVLVDGSKQVMVSVPYELLPEHLKTIIIEVGNPNAPDTPLRFLLRVDDAYTAYTTVLPALRTHGEFPMTLSIYDHLTREIGTVTGVLAASFEPAERDLGAGFIAPFETNRYIFYLFIFLLLLMALGYSGQRLLRAQW